MPHLSAAKQPGPTVRASIDTDNSVKYLDLFVDHTRSEGIKSDINLIATRPGVFSDYLRDILTPIVCPNCGLPSVRRASRRGPKEWLLKFTGRRAFHCADCDWHEVVKVQAWEWDIVAAVAACGLIIAFASFNWIFR